MLPAWEVHRKTWGFIEGPGPASGADRHEEVTVEYTEEENPQQEGHGVWGDDGWRGKRSQTGLGVWVPWGSAEGQKVSWGSTGDRSFSLRRLGWKSHSVGVQETTAQKWQTGLLSSHGDWETGGTLGTRNVKRPEDLPRGMGTPPQSNARLAQAAAEDLALLTASGVSVPPGRLSSVVSLYP